MSAKTTDFYKSLLSMQPRQLGLVFCSENNNAKQALPDQKDSRKLEISVLVYGKRRLLWSRIKKWAENEQGVFMHTYTYTFPFICRPELPSDLELLLLSCWNWRLPCGSETMYWGKEAQLMQVQTWDNSSGTSAYNSTEYHECHTPQDEHNKSTALNRWSMDRHQLKAER